MIRLGWINSLFGGLLISLCCPCCVLPVLLNIFGVGCAGLNAFLLPYRPVFIVLTVISLTYSYFRYHPSKSQLLVMILLTSCLSFSPEILRLSTKQTSSNVPLNIDGTITHWQIIGMHCQSCQMTVTKALEKIDGIVSVNVDLDSGQADLFARIPIDDEVVIRAVQSIGFQTFKII